MGSKLFPSLAAAAFAAMLFNFFLRRRSSEIKGEQANNDAASNDGTARGASSTHIATEGRELTTSPRYVHEVFLSCRAQDTRAGFTDFLYTMLTKMGIRTYIYEEDLCLREEIGPDLQAIKWSKIAIPILSKGYAASVWCLNVLVQMIECQKVGRQKILPIFYDVHPSEVRYQIGAYEEAFRSHKKKGYSEETMLKWKDALRVVGVIKGWIPHSIPTRQEGKLAKSIALEAFNYLKSNYLLLPNCLVHVNHQVDKIMEMIGAQTSETRIIGIHGRCGSGKTTIAKIIYNQLADNFKHHCFLSNIREVSKRKGITHLQHQLIFDILKVKWLDIGSVDEGTRVIEARLSDKRVLLLLDDVKEACHIDALAGKPDWFGRGSKLIITTREKDILNAAFQVDRYYEVNGMDRDQSLQLFSKHAFGRDYPSDEYINQSNKAIDIADGLPSALEYMGSLLSHTEKEMWDIKLKKSENVLHQL